MSYKISAFMRSSLGRYLSLLRARMHGENADFCNFSSRQCLVTSSLHRSVLAPWHAVAFPRLVNSGLVLPCNPSHLPIALTHQRGQTAPSISCSTFPRENTAPGVDCDVPSGQNSAARFEISTVTNESSLDPLLKSVSRFHSFSALLVCSDYHLLRP